MVIASLFITTLEAEFGKAFSFLQHRPNQVRSHYDLAWVILQAWLPNTQSKWRDKYKQKLILNKLVFPKASHQQGTYSRADYQKNEKKA